MLDLSKLQLLFHMLPHLSPFLNCLLTVSQLLVQAEFHMPRENALFFPPVTPINSPLAVLSLLAEDSSGRWASCILTLEQFVMTLEPDLLMQ